MNQVCFEFLMRAVDDDLLEEAQHPMKRSRSWLWASGIAAACFVILAAAWFLTNPGWGRDQPVNPVHQATAAEVMQLGYTLPVPEGAREVSYTLVDRGDQNNTPMAEVTYKSGGHAYSCRALKVSRSEDISGIEEDWTQKLDWTVGTLEMQLRQSDEDTAWVGWYAPDVGVQWCLSGDTDAQSLLHTARAIMETLGYDIAVAPEDAENVVYNAFELDGFVVGETVFTLNGVSYFYHIASTWEIETEFADISGLEGEFRNQTTGEVMWCPARLYFDDGGTGKVVWFDVVPGLLYSLSMDQGASEEALLEMANQLFTPAQGDAG